MVGSWWFLGAKSSIWDRTFDIGELEIALAEEMD
jgi:hypothetical protein